jgi:hypothetical protein
MRKVDAWWWICVPYSLVFPLLVLISHSEEGIGHSLGALLLLAMLTTALSCAWMIVVVYKVFLGRKAVLDSRTVGKLGAILLALFLWAIMLKIAGMQQP